MISSQYQNLEGWLQGTGTVVAIIDSGLDLNHEVLRISDPSKAKFKNKEAIEAAKKAAGIDYGKWYSDKVVYAYDYFDGTDKIKEAERTSHGMHVTGIAAGNPDKEAPNGEKGLWCGARSSSYVYACLFQTAKNDQFCPLCKGD